MRDLTLAYKLIRTFEGLRLHAYQDTRGIWTIGYGTTAGVRPGQTITQAQAESLMEIDVQHRASEIASWCKVPVSDNQLCSMVSLAYNVGMGAFYHSQLLADLNSGKPKAVCARDFYHFENAGGVPVLAPRRKQEAAVFVA